MKTNTEVNWRPVRTVRSTHELVLEQVEEQILFGALRVGDRLPAEREFAEKLGVSRGAVREAMRVLESLGVVRASTGSGPGAGSVIVGQGTEAIGTLLRLHLSLASFGEDDVVAIRTVLEGWAVRTAAAQASEEEIEGLRSLVADMSRPDVELGEFHELDAKFHMEIANLTRNSLVGIMMSGLREAIKRRMVSAFESLPQGANVVPRLCSEHGAIVDAIAMNDGDRAADLAQSHIVTFYEQEARRASV